MSGSERLTKAALIAEAALDRKAEDIVALDVRAVTSFADTFVIATGTSDRNVRSIADSIAEAMTKRGEKPLGIEGYEEGRWVLIDLERLWSDAPQLDVGDGAGPAAVQK